MAAPRLSTVVTWSVSRIPLWRRVARRLPGLLLLAVEVLLGGVDTMSTGEQMDPRMEPDLEPMGWLGVVSVVGRGAGMPAAYPGRQSVTVHQRRAAIEPGLVEIDLPLTTLKVVEANRVGVRWTRRKAADAMWQLRAVGPGVDLTFRGRWVLLAQLGTLGEWPEPV